MENYTFLKTFDYTTGNLILQRVTVLDDDRGEQVKIRYIDFDNIVFNANLGHFDGKCVDDRKYVKATVDQYTNVVDKSRLVNIPVSTIGELPPVPLGKDWAFDIIPDKV